MVLACNEFLVDQALGIPVMKRGKRFFRFRAYIWEKRYIIFAQLHFLYFKSGSASGHTAHSIRAEYCAECPFCHTSRVLLSISVRILLHKCGQYFFVILQCLRNFKAQLVQPVFSPEHSHRNRVHGIYDTVILSVIDHGTPEGTVIIGIRCLCVIRSLFPDLFDGNLSDDSTINKCRKLT